MQTLEHKIKKNRNIIALAFAKKGISISSNFNVIKAGFSDGWDKGWGNYGKTFKPVPPERPKDL